MGALAPLTGPTRDGWCTTTAGLVTVWATRDDLDALIARWPDEGDNRGEPASCYFERMRRSLLNAAARWDEILCGWMSEAARRVMEPGQSWLLPAAAAS